MTDETPEISVLSAELVAREVELARRRRASRQRLQHAKRALAMLVVALVPALACAAAKRSALGVDGVAMLGLL